MRRLRSAGMLLGAVIVALSGLRPAPAWSQSANASVQMTVTAVVNLTVSTSSTSLPTFTSAEFNAGMRTGVSGPSLTVKANRAWVVSIKGQAWTGTANHSKPVSDLQWSTNGTTYTGLTTSLAQLLPGSGNGSPTSSTVQSVLYRWLLHTGTDTPGTYSMVVTYTLSAP